MKNEHSFTVGHGVLVPPHRIKFNRFWQDENGDMVYEFSEVIHKDEYPESILLAEIIKGISEIQEKDV